MADYESVAGRTGIIGTPESQSTLSDKNLQEALEALAEREDEVSKLHQQIKEILRINHKWDDEYKELKRLYESSGKEQVGTSSSSQGKNGDGSTISQDKDQLSEQLKTLKSEKEKVERKYSDLKAKYDHIKSQRNELLKTQAKAGPAPPSTRLEQMKEEIDLLNSQVQAYKEDYEAEKRDRERLVSEKETDRLRYEAEIVSLKIQLDRSTSEMAHYKSEAKRFGQQLRLRQQREEEQFRRHLESQGYSARKALPPLDPFVEKDVYPLYYSQSNPSISPSSLPSPTSTMPQTRRLSLGYQTHMSEVTRPLYESDQVRRRSSIPFYSQTHNSPPRNNYHNNAPKDHGTDLRSVSPQIHRVGNLRLYSRESDPNLIDVSSNTEGEGSLCNNLDTSYEQAVQRRVELDVKSSLHNGDGGFSLANGGFSLANGGEMVGGEELANNSLQLNAEDSTNRHSSSI